jgi:hypothetical protein
MLEAIERQSVEHPVIWANRLGHRVSGIFLCTAVRIPGSSGQ